jgi:hypothetical protein
LGKFQQLSTMPPSAINAYPNPTPQALVLGEQGIEDAIIAKLRDLKYTYRPDITNRVTLEKNFREKFEALTRSLTAESERSEG